jgi:hypothetical protein
MDPAYLDYLLLAAGGFAMAALGFAIAWLRARERAVRAEAQLALGHEQQLGAAAEARFDRLEQLAEANALEIERLAEAQHFQGRLLAGHREEGAPQSTRAPGIPERVITPH